MKRRGRGRAPVCQHRDGTVQETPEDGKFSEEERVHIGIVRTDPDPVQKDEEDAQSDRPLLGGPKIHRDVDRDVTQIGSFPESVPDTGLHLLVG